MKKTVLLVLLALTVLLSGCNKTTPVTPDTMNQQPSSSTACTSHVDSDSNGLCDRCFAKVDANSGSDNPSSGPENIPTPKPPLDSSCTSHVDDDSNGVCDQCQSTVFVYFDFYNINDLHGKLADADSHPGVDELTTYLKNARQEDDFAFFLSTGDMWQGSAESNMTNGHIMTDWMNQLGFIGMSLGNHEFDWGTDAIKSNHTIAEFPFLAINIYDRETNSRVDYCTPSVVVEGNGIQIGIIGAIGDCYSSIAVDKCKDVYFKTGNDLTNLVKTESERLRKEGVDFIVYTIHDGYDKSTNGSVENVSSSKISSYYDTSLSNGYVDLVFEGHTHQGYRLKDEYGVYHLQNRGDNKGGISHVEIAINSVDYTSSVRVAELVSTNQYKSLPDDPIVSELLDKYESQISGANKVLGYNSSYRYSDEMEQLVANLYYQFGLETWGDQYDIVLGGGFIRTRSPYNLSTGEVTYGMLQSLFPFDNELMLCSIKGRDLRNKFFNTGNEDYFIDYGDYGASLINNINTNAIYYIVVDSYTAYYSPNRLTVIDTYGAGTYARDLLADYISKGGLE